MERDKLEILLELAKEFYSDESKLAEFNTWNEKRKEATNDKSISTSEVQGQRAC